ncbi:GAF domain-containing SpoIIE family protein phosphatase [Streptomyces sp. NPDC004533]|uniref:PP2C family protein-serine/threonine phosphatase n=1 Tax=Streptomyces sp. NPDC004533 TaxID=3154278 RepID=UPI0033B1765F
MKRLSRDEGVIRSSRRYPFHRLDSEPHMQGLPPSESPVREVSAGFRHAAAIIRAAAGAGEQVALLGTASRAIGTTLDLCRTVKEMTAVLVPAMADYGTVDLLEPVLRGEDPPASGLEDRSVWHRAAVHGIDQGPLRTLRDVVPELDTASPLCEPRLVPRLGHGGTWSRQKRPGGAILRRFGLHSMMAIPLAARGQVLGLVTLYRGRRRASFSQADLQIAIHIGAFAALALDNARRYARERAVALELQMSLLPREIPLHPGLEITHRYLPASRSAVVGGDWLDVVPLPDGRLALTIGDASGHDIHAAAAMGRLRTLMQAEVSRGRSPAELLETVDELMAAGGHAQSDIATCLHGVYDPVSRRCTIARAGHPPPAVLHPNGSVEFPDIPAGPPLGIGGQRYAAAELQLAEGDILVMYTDGLIETHDQDIDVGMDRLAAALGRGGHSLNQLCDSVLTDLRPHGGEDDITLLAVAIRDLPHHRTASWDLSCDSTEACRARHLIRGQLEQWNLPMLADTAEPLIEELVSAATCDNGCPLGVRLHRTDVLLVEVLSARGSLRGAPRGGCGSGELRTVGDRAQHWGVRDHADGRTVWFEIALGADEHRQ